MNIKSYKYAVLIIILLALCDTKNQTIYSKSNTMKMELFRAIKNNDSKMVINLIKKGVDINCFIYAGFFKESDLKSVSGSPLSYAVLKNKINIVKILLRNGVKIKDCPSIKFAAKNCNIEITKLLLQHGDDVNARDEYGLTPISSTLGSYCPVVAEFLLKKGADPNSQSDDDLSTPLHISVHLFISRSFDPTKDYLAVPKLLVKYGADPNLKDSSARTPLGVAKLVLARCKKGMKGYKYSIEQQKALQQYIKFLKPLTKKNKQ